MRGGADRHRRAIRATAALAALAVAIAVPGSALAAPTWLATAALSVSGENAFQPQVVVNPAGDALAAWTREDEVLSNHVIQVSGRTAGGVWQAPVDLSAVGEDAIAPQLAVDPAGDAVAVWQREVGGQAIRAATRPAGGAWGPPVDLPAGGEVAADPHVAIDDVGDAVAVWDGHEGSQPVIQAANRPAGGSWQAPVDLSAAGQNAEEARVALDPAGDAVALWRRWAGSEWVIQAASRPAGGVWGAPVTLSATGAGERANEPQLAVDPAGDVVAVWHRFDGSHYVVQAASRQAGGAWGAPVDLSATGKNANQPQVAMDSGGDATVVWGYYGISEGVVQVAGRRAGGAWQAPVDLSATGVDPEEARVAVDSAGDAVAIWDGYDGSEWLVQARSRPAGGSWAPAAILSGAGAFGASPSLAVDEAGDAAAVWRRFDGHVRVIEAAGYDAAGPQLRSLSIPATGTVGRPLTFSVSPLDVWSSPGGVEWSFGDGAGAIGTLTTHTYGAPGTYTVGVGVADAYGNGSRAAGTVTIEPAPAPAPGPVVPGAHGKASARRLVTVRGGVARLALGCGAAAACAGTARLAVPVKARRGGGASARRRPRQIRIGRAAFDLAAGAHRTIKAPLTRKGRALVRAASRRGLAAKLTGSGVVGRTVVLKAVGRRRALAKGSLSP